MREIERAELQKVEERLSKYKEKYEVGFDWEFNLVSMLELEQEYRQLSDTNPEHTSRRHALIQMINELRDSLRLYPKKAKQESLEVGKVSWGDMYSKEKQVNMDQFYKDMHKTHSISTPQHEKALIMICKLQQKMEDCLDCDDIPEYSKRHKEYQKLMQVSGFRPIDVQ